MSLKIFLAGAAGVIGRRLVPLLIERGYEVHGTTRSQARASDLERSGARPIVLDAFDRGADVHTTTAATVFHVDESAVDDAQRRFAKVVNYGLAYGMEAFGLGQRPESHENSL